MAKADDSSLEKMREVINLPESLRQAQERLSKVLDSIKVEFDGLAENVEKAFFKIGLKGKEAEKGFEVLMKAIRSVGETINEIQPKEILSLKQISDIEHTLSSVMNLLRRFAQEPKQIASGYEDIVKFSRQIKESFEDITMTGLDRFVRTVNKLKEDWKTIQTILMDVATDMSVINNLGRQISSIDLTSTPTKLYEQLSNIRNTYEEIIANLQKKGEVDLGTVFTLREQVDTVQRLQLSVSQFVSDLPRGVERLVSMKEEYEKMKGMFADLGSLGRVLDRTMSSIWDRTKAVDVTQKEYREKVMDVASVMNLISSELDKQPDKVKKVAYEWVKTRAEELESMRERERVAARAGRFGMGEAADILSRVPGMGGISDIMRLLAGGSVYMIIFRLMTDLIKEVDKFIVRMVETQRSMAVPGVAPPVAPVTVDLVTHVKAEIARANMPQVLHEEVVKMLSTQLKYGAELFIKANRDMLSAGESLLTYMNRAMLDPRNQEYQKQLQSALETSTVALLKFSEATGFSQEDILRMTISLARSGGIMTASLNESIPVISMLTVSSRQAAVSIDEYIKWVDQVQRLTRFYSMSIYEANMIVNRWSEDLKKGIITVQDITEALKRAYGSMGLEDLAMRFQLLSNIIDREGSPQLKKLFSLMQKEGPEGVTVFLQSILEGKNALDLLSRMYPGLYDQIISQVGGYDMLIRVSNELMQIQGKLRDEFHRSIGAMTPLQKAFVDMYLGLPSVMPPRRAEETIEQWAKRFQMTNEILAGYKGDYMQMTNILNETKSILDKIKDFYEVADIKRGLLKLGALIDEYLGLPKFLSEVLTKPVFVIPVKHEWQDIFRPTPTFTGAEQPTTQKKEGG